MENPSTHNPMDPEVTIQKKRYDHKNTWKTE